MNKGMGVAIPELEIVENTFGQGDQIRETCESQGGLYDFMAWVSGSY